jgi:hypothetical protein
MWALVRLSARVRLLFRGGGNRAGSGPVAEFGALAQWCRCDVLAVLREREQAD